MSDIRAGTDSARRPLDEAERARSDRSAPERRPSTVVYDDAFPTTRPPGLRRRSLPTGTELWRIDGSNVAFFSLDGFEVEDNRVLAACVAELDDLVLHHRFSVGFSC